MVGDIWACKWQIVAIPKIQAAVFFTTQIALRCQAVSVLVAAATRYFRETRQSQIDSFVKRTVNDLMLIVRLVLKVLWLGSIVWQSIKFFIASLRNIFVGQFSYFGLWTLRPYSICLNWALSLGHMLLKLNLKSFSFSNSEFSRKCLHYLGRKCRKVCLFLDFIHRTRWLKLIAYLKCE